MSPPSASPGAREAPGGVQSIGRVFALLEAMADLGGVAGVSELAGISGLPMPTIHRLLRTMVGLGYIRQEPSREYALGPRLVHLGEGASRLLETWANPHLRRLAEVLGESANFALIDGIQVIYVAQAAGRHSMRLFTEVGHRADLHCTAMGKAIIATYPPELARAVIRDLAFRSYTPHTISNARVFLEELHGVRVNGYALDLGEQEIGVNCVAVALPGSPARGAVSVSGPSDRITASVIRSAVPLLRRSAAALSAELAGMRGE